MFKNCINFRSPFAAIVIHTLKAAHRDMLFLGNIVAIVIATLVAFFMGSTALTEQSEMKIVYTATMSRVITVSGMIIFVCFHVRRMFENREVEMIISRPVSRNMVIIAMFTGFSILVLPMILVTIAILFPLANKIGLIYWGISLMLECWTMIAFTMFFSLLIEGSIFSLMMSLLTYFMSRAIGSFVAYISLTNRLKELYIFQSLSEAMIKVVSIMIPRLDFCAKSSWLIYGLVDSSMFYFSVIQTLIISSVIVLATMHDFKKKDF